MAVKSISFRVPGIPATAGSKKPFLYRGKDGKQHASMAPDNKRQKPWMNQVALFASQVYRDPPMTGAVTLVIEFTFSRPKSHFGTGKNADVLKPSYAKYMTKKPDVSKMVRAVEDALTGIVWKDDSQVISLDASKRYGDRPGAAITIWEME